MLDKLERVKADPNVETKEDLEKLTEDELAILRTIRARQMLRGEEAMNGVKSFSQDVIDGWVPRLVRGRLGMDRVQDRVAAPKYEESVFESGLADKEPAPGLEQRAEGAVQV